MKYVRNNPAAPFPTKMVLRDIIKYPGDGVKGVDEMGHRIKLLNLVKDTPDGALSIALEDAEHTMLLRLTEEFRAGIVDEAIHNVMLDVKNPMSKAEEPAGKPDKPGKSR